MQPNNLVYVYHKNTGEIVNPATGVTMAAFNPGTKIVLASGDFETHFVDALMELDASLDRVEIEQFLANPPQGELREAESILLDQFNLCQKLWEVAYG